MNFRQLDLNLLRVLGAVYRSGSVTEAGHQLALSQPAVSNALARLRRYFEDPLFVPSPGGLHPTRLAQRVARLIPGYAYDEDHFFGVDGALEGRWCQRCEALGRKPATLRVSWHPWHES